MLKNILKFSTLGLVLVAAGVGALYGAGYVRYRQSPEYRVMQEYERMERAYAEDTYGGNTPEETLRLFIDALKKEDAELASKYFVVEKWEKEKTELLSLHQKERDQLIIDIERDLTTSQKKYVGNDQATFERVEQSSGGFVEFGDKKIPVPPGNYVQTTTLFKNEKGKWKIMEL